jgi:poly(A) polymerase
MGETPMSAVINFDFIDLLKLFDEARLVGGAVRDFVLNRPIHDYDIATTLRPKQVMKSGLFSIPTGLKHGTVTVLYNDIAYQVTTLRQDVETDGRHAKVKFGRSFEQDAARRDFTMNALSMDKNGVIHDYFGGRADAENGIVRFIGAPETRIKEDYLRILRFFRFHKHYGKGDYHEESYKACLALQEGLDDLSRERVREELFKAGFELPREILTRLIGEHTPCDFITDDPVLRLAQLSVRTRDDALRLKSALKLSNEQYRRLDSLAVGHAVHSLNEAKAMLYACGKRAYMDRITLYGASEFADLPESWMPPTFPITGARLKKQGFVEGEEMGAELARLKAEWLKNGCAF